VSFDPVALAPDAGPSVLRDCADAEAYVASVCFKHGPPSLTGVELEWLARGPTTAAQLRAALGPHCPPSLDPTSPALPLPGGSTVTVEPGGQLELASPPLASLSALLATTADDAAVLLDRAAAAGMTPESRAAAPQLPPVRVLDHPRYAAMERSFDRRGVRGRVAMCSTSAVQVCVDAGEGAGIRQRWQLAHALGPVLLAAFANSPRLHGRATGWKSSRWAEWSAADPSRTAPPEWSDVAGEDPAAAWARRVVSTPLLCVRRDDGAWSVPSRVTFADWIRGALTRRPTVDDLEYHVSTLFPPVRPRGHLEIRYVDMQPGERWALPVAVLAALLSDPGVADQALEACEPARERWVAAARRGLEDAVLARAARRVFALAHARLPALEPPAWLVEDLTDQIERQVERGRCPADLPEGALL
jgi:glutamate--cysteine ligase